uniref:Uncharacterized protein n=1 Tax=Opuntia streptacantha TaxID=393608 RepID=A0A7C9B743_OPUST
MDIIKSLRMNPMDLATLTKMGALHLAVNLIQQAQVLGMTGTRRMTGHQARSRGDHCPPNVMMAGLAGMTPKMMSDLKTSIAALLMGKAQALVAMGSQTPCGVKAVFSEFHLI